MIVALSHPDRRATIAALFVLPVIGSLSSQGAWKPVVVLVACMALIAALLVLMLLPEGNALKQSGTPTTNTADQKGWRHVGFAMEVLRECSASSAFWLLAISFFVCGATTNGLVGSHLVAFCADNGIGPVLAAGLMSTMGIFDLIGTNLSGYFVDRFNPWRLLMWLYFTRGIALLVLSSIDISHERLLVFTAVYGLNYVATVPPTARLANRHFGDRAGPIAFGWIMVAHQIGAAIAAFGGGAIRGISGSYNLAFIGSGILVVGVAALLICHQRIAGSSRLAALF